MTEREYDASVDLHDSYYAAVGELRQRHEAGQVPARQTAGVALRLPGTRTSTSLTLPDDLSQEDWIACGQLFAEAEGALQWWIGDWWAFGEHRYGDRKAIVESDDWAGPNYQACKDAGSVARAYERSARYDLLSFTHHRYAMAAEESERMRWLEKAAEEGLSTNQLRAAISHAAAADNGLVQPWHGRVWLNPPYVAP